MITGPSPASCVRTTYWTECERYHVIISTVAMLLVHVHDHCSLPSAFMCIYACMRVGSYLMHLFGSWLSARGSYLN
jgi:hypothetical protein